MPALTRETQNRSLSLLGLVASGDLGPLTMYRSHLGRIVSFAKTWPKFPPTLAQLTGRARMNFGAEQWRHFTPQQKRAWKLGARRLGAAGTGYNLWQMWWFCKEPSRVGKIDESTYPGLADCITRTQPELPANPKIQPTQLSDPSENIQVRYGRNRIFAPTNTTVYMTFLAYDLYTERETPLESYWALYGPGAYSHSPVRNAEWCWASFHTPAQKADSTLELTVYSPAGMHDITATAIHTRVIF